MITTHCFLKSRYKTWCIIITAVSVFMAVFSVINSGCLKPQTAMNYRYVGKGFENILIEAELRHKEEIDTLKTKANLLKNRIDSLPDETGELPKEVVNQNSLREKLTGRRFSEKRSVEDPSQVHAASRSIESSFKIHHDAEYNVEPFEKFDLQYVYTLGYSLGKRSVEKLIGARKKEIMEVLQDAINILNEDRDLQSLVKNSNFWEGFFRTFPKIGTQYKLFFKIQNGTTNRYFAKTVIFRPFGPLISTNNPQFLYNQNEVIHVIVPLQDRIETLKRFLANFVNVCVFAEGKIDLTLVAFGQNVTAIANLINSVSKKYKHTSIELIRTQGEFSRAKALEIGVKSVRQNDEILFLCDVDIIFTADFLSRCRLNTSPGQSVYYPIVFSLFNPSLVYRIDGKVSVLQRSKLKVSDFGGFWRDFGFGMVCVSKSDFKDVGGFGDTIPSGWGQEDLILYRKFIRSPKYEVIRSVDQGIFHSYHKKMCDVNLTNQQYSDCIRSKAVNEASHAQLGQLAFKDEIDLRRNKNYYFQRQKLFNP